MPVDKVNRPNRAGPGPRRGEAMMLSLWSFISGALFMLFCLEGIPWILVKKAKPPSPEVLRMLAHLKGRE